MFEKRSIVVQFVILGSLCLLDFLITWLNEIKLINIDRLSFSVIALNFLIVIGGFVLIGRYQRSKIFKPLIEDHISSMGYQLISERPLTFAEILNDPELVTISVIGIPVQALTYKSKNARMLHVLNNHEVNMLLHVIIITTWKNEIRVEIQGKTRLG